MFRFRLKELMQQKAMTLGQVAVASGLSPRTIKALCRDIVSGRTRLSTLECLADALGVSLCELVEYTSGRPVNRLSAKREREQ